MDSQTFIFFGIVGSGKGTQIKLLQDFLRTKDQKDQVYAYPGSDYRRLIESGGYIGNLLKDNMDKGYLQPDFFTTTIFSNSLITSLTPEKHLIADGYPRTISQAESFESMMNFFDRKNIIIIYIELSKEEATKRMKLRGRRDDTDEAILNRFDEYVKNVVPSMDYFRDKSNYRIITINGDQSIEDVHNDIKKALNYL